MPELRIAMIPGDGIGPEVSEASRRLLHHVAGAVPGLIFEIEEWPWNAEYYLEHGRTMPPIGLALLEEFDAVFLGAIGDPRVPDHISLRELIFAIRQGFDQYVNLRPVRLLNGVTSPLAGRGTSDFHMTFVRENSEGEYSGLGEFRNVGEEDEAALQTSVFTRRGVERIMRYAFDLARAKRLPLQSVSKANALNYSGVLWDVIFTGLQDDYPDVTSESLLVDAAALHMIQSPERFGVVVASNLFGDILTDLGAALVGGLGLAASANINPQRTYPSMFEPVHGSAPDIAGQGIANPLASLWATGMMLDHLLGPGWEETTVEAIERVLVDGRVRTPDLGGTASTDEMTEAVLETFRPVGGSV